ncbi:MAG: CiaB protein, partial [Campylobacteraceae bacterium]|nr:CiaB protein [Campylobacteraceae bacterium]
MPQQTFIKDTQIIYDYITTEKAHVNILFEHLEKENFDKLTLIDEFAKELNLDENLTNEKRLSLITRIVSLRDDSLVQTLKKENKTADEIIELQEKAYLFVKKFWEKKHKKTVDFIKKNNLLIPFYQEIFKGVYNVGLAMSTWQSSWTAHIINGVNKDLMEKFDNNEEKVFTYLEDNHLLDLGHNEQIADRCYSALVLEGEKYKSKAYIHAFRKETLAVIDALEEFEDALVNLEDNVYNQKWEYV